MVLILDENHGRSKRINDLKDNKRQKLPYGTKDLKKTKSNKRHNFREKKYLIKEKI